jgi:hypothetical protein
MASGSPTSLIRVTPSRLRVVEPDQFIVVVS